MKQILLLRHAKSSWDNPDLDDFDRPLANRGLKDAPRMGKYVRSIGYKPGLIISSPAERARQTAELFAENAQIDPDLISWDEDLYYGGTEDYLAAINEVPESADRVMLVGHNPLMENVTAKLTSAPGRMSVRMPTAALVCLQSFANSWEEISPGTCQMKWMMIPKVLKKLKD